MADRGRPILHPRGDIRQTLPEAVQPPDDRTYSAEVTAFRRNLPHHRIARCEKSADFPCTRLNNIPRIGPIVKHIFRKNHKLNCVFSVNMENYFYFFTADRCPPQSYKPPVSVGNQRKREGHSNAPPLLYNITSSVPRDSPGCSLRTGAGNCHTGFFRCDRLPPPDAQHSPVLFCGSSRQTGRSR